MTNIQLPGGVNMHGGIGHCMLLPGGRPNGGLLSVFCIHPLFLDSSIFSYGTRSEGYESVASLLLAIYSEMCL